MIERVAPEFREFAIARTGQIVQGSIAPPVSMRWLRMDGTAFDVEVSASPFPTAEGVSIQVFVREVTERKQAERKIARVAHLYLALSHAAQLAFGARTREELFADACRIAVEYGELRTCCIGLADAANARVVPVASSGPGRDYCFELHVSLDAGTLEGQGLVATAIRDCVPVVCNDIAQEPRVRPWLDRALAFGLRSFVVFPLFEQDIVVGVIAYYADEENYFPSDPADLLGRVAEQISHALDRIASEQCKHEAEAALRAQQRSMAMLMDSLPGMVYRCRADEKWTMDFVSDGCLELTGYRADELTRSDGMEYTRLIEPGDLAKVHMERDMRRALQNGEFVVHYQPKAALRSGVMMGQRRSCAGIIRRRA